MCRLAAFPPGFPRGLAVKILSDFAANNDDGTGYAFVKDGQFQVRKWPTSLEKVFKADEKKTFLDHMPYPGWTIAHLRAASHGVNVMANTHPFVVGDWCVAHNGIWGEYKLAKSIIQSLAPSRRFHGQTDSEVAANLLALVGPKKFQGLVEYGGVFLALNKDGSLWAVKTSGELERLICRGKTTLASEFSTTVTAETVPDGWIELSPTGRLRNSYKAPLPKSYSNYYSAKDDVFTRYGTSYKPGYRSKAVIDDFVDDLPPAKGVGPVREEYTGGF